MAPNLHIELESLPVDRSSEFHQKVVNGIEDLLLVLAEDGRILHASPKSLSLIQVKPEALVGRYISTYMNVDDIPVFLIEWKENMALGSSWRTHHRLRQGDDTYKPFESTYKPYTDMVVDDETGSKTSTKLCLMTSRPYQITSTSLMDSFLEHYTTNIRLTNQLAQLKGEAEEFYESTMSTKNADTTVQCATFKLETTTATATATATATTTTLSSNLEVLPATRSETGSAISSRRRSLSESTTSTKPQVDSVVGDIGIEIATSRLQTMKETGAWTAKPRTKKRKQELCLEHLCKECGTTESPEWRRGPRGSKTLCNACGLRWSKVQKESTSSHLGLQSSQ